VGPGSLPNAPTEGEWVNATERSGSLRLSGFSVMDYRNPNVYYMFAESPVPEPSTLAMAIVLGLTGVVGWVWRRCREGKRGQVRFH